MVEKQSEKVNNIFYLSLIFAFSFILANIKIRDPDAFIHIKLGEYAIQNLTIPDRDPFVYTYTGSQYNNSAWLSQIIYYLIYKHTGIHGLIIFNATLVGITYTILFIVSRLMGLSRFLGIIFLLTVSYASKERFILRPHIFSLLFLSITVYLTSINLSKRRYFLFFLLFLLWANLHAGFIYGIIMLTCSAADGIIKKSLKPLFNLLSAIGGSAITPVPFAGYRFSTGLVKLKSTAEVLEWRSLIESHYIFLTVIVIVSILLTLVNWRKNTIKDWLVLCIFAPAGFWAFRNTYELLIVITPSAISGLYEFLKVFKFAEKFKTKPLIEAAPLILVSIFLFDFKLGDYYSLIGHGIDPRKYPSGAINYFKKINIKGNIFNSFNFGGALAFELYPERMIFIDGLSSGIAQEFLEEYVEATEDGEKFEKLAEEYNIGIIIVESDRGYIKRGIFNPEKWKMVYWDDSAMILLRKDMLPPALPTIELGDPSDIIYETMAIPVRSSGHLLNELNKSRNVSDSFMANLATGILLKRQGRIDDAIEVLEHAFLKQPFSFLCMYMLAESYEDAGYIYAAQWLLRRIIFLNGGLTGLRGQPYRISRREIKKIKYELENMEINN